MRINYFHHELHFFKEAISTSFSPLQKRIFTIASIAIGCLVACMVLTRCCNFFSKKIQADKTKIGAQDDENLSDVVHDSLDPKNLIKKINENPRISLKDMGFKDIDQFLEFAKTSGSKLQNLNLHETLSVTNKQLKELVKYCPNLHQLFISSDKISNEGLQHLSPLTALQTLNLGECEQITDAGLAHLAPLTALQTLELGECELITDAGLAHLAPLTALQTLDLCGCKQFTDAGLAHLAPLTALQTLNLGGCEQITDAGLAHLAQLTALQTLNLQVHADHRRRPCALSAAYRLANA